MTETYVPGPRRLQATGIEAPSFEELADIAIENLRKQGPSGVVCGPISTGGTGHQTTNFEVFNAAIRGLQKRGASVFSQIPYEYGLRELAHKWEEAGGTGYCMPILTVFYARLFDSGLITHGWFIPGWQSSHGARFEREKLETLGAIIDDLTRDNIIEFLADAYSPEHAMKVAALIPA